MPATLLKPRARRHARPVLESVAFGVPLDVGSFTDVGRVRASNEDALLTLEAGQAGPLLVAVADGMGGHNAGEVASAIAVESLSRFFAGGTELADAVVQANASI